MVLAPPRLRPICSGAQQALITLLSLRSSAQTMQAEASVAGGGDGRVSFRNNGGRSHASKMLGGSRSVKLQSVRGRMVCCTLPGCLWSAARSRASGTRLVRGLLFSRHHGTRTTQTSSFASAPREVGSTFDPRLETWAGAVAGCRENQCRVAVPRRCLKQAAFRKPSHEVPTAGLGDEVGSRVPIRRVPELGIM